MLARKCRIKERKESSVASVPKEIFGRGPEMEGMIRGMKIRLCIANKVYRNVPSCTVVSGRYATVANDRKTGIYNDAGADMARTSLDFRGFGAADERIKAR